jgi:rhodanese-related sulfurtransferase
MSQLPLRYQELPMGTTIYLDAAGWDVVNVLGGTQAWINAGYPLENR